MMKHADRQEYAKFVSIRLRLPSSSHIYILTSS